MSRSLIALVLLGGSGLVLADVSLPSVISDHMVLQQGVSVPVWGKADPGENVTVGFDGQTKEAVAGADGRWIVRLDALKAMPDQSGKTMTIKGKNAIILQDVLIGETWLCSGQSNMQFPLSGSFDSQSEIAAANFPTIRLFTVANRMSTEPQYDCEGQWVVCSPETAKDFSAVGYFFGRHLNQALNLPVGLINSSWGGTVAEAWVGEGALRKNLPEFIPCIEAQKSPNAIHAVAEYHKEVAHFQAEMEKLFVTEEDLSSAAATAGVDFDDSSWKTMELPGNWETRGLSELDGMVWYRKTIDVPVAWAGQDIILKLGPVDEVDVTWFNGAQVGASGCSRCRDVQYWNQAREYRVTGSLVKAGSNVIAVRVSDTSGQGGLWGDAPESMRVELAEGSARIPLAGEWKYWVKFKLPPPTSDPETPNRPSVLFNAMIHPLQPFAIGGVIWYQGESNTDRAAQYRTLLPTLIRDWRSRFGEFPFLIVQLANFMAPADSPRESAWAELREAQTFTTGTLPKVGQALAIDLGDAMDIHPRNKEDVGRRLGLVAEAIAYGRDVEYSGPVFKEMLISDGKAELSFTHTDGGLKFKGDTNKAFAISGADKKFVWAEAEIQGDKVVVSSPEVTQPVAVRYAWGDNPSCNLVNGADLPAVPFRTEP